MNAQIAFLRKEIMEQTRSGRLMLLGVLFALFGIMNPAVAKLTPWLLEIMSDTLAGNGMIVTTVTVSAMDSWVQFFKNIPMALIAFVLTESSIFTKEYQSGTLVLSLTKGLHRDAVLRAKTTVLVVLWTLCYWGCFGITYVYNAYFWDNAVAKNLLFSVVCWWLFGLWTVALMVLFSVVTGTNTGVLLGTGGVVFVSYLLGILPEIKVYVPTQLTDGNALIYGTAGTGDYTAALIAAVVLSAACFAVSVPVFRKKQL
ncbi:MAG: ABC transporter permease subunit [Clostridia bacterium]|nr:ABC transporter permease subunit [Clostridia bacterium]